MYGDSPAKNTVYTPYIPINVRFWPTLLMSNGYICLRLRIAHLELRYPHLKKVHLLMKAHQLYFLLRRLAIGLHFLAKCVCLMAQYLILFDHLRTFLI